MGICLQVNDLFLSKMAMQERFELPTDGLEGRCSIQLSYCTKFDSIGIITQNMHVVKTKIKSNLFSFYSIEKGMSPSLLVNTKIFLRH